MILTAHPLKRNHNCRLITSVPSLLMEKKGGWIVYNRWPRLPIMRRQSHLNTKGPMVPLKNVYICILLVLSLLFQACAGRVVYRYKNDSQRPMQSVVFF